MALAGADLIPGVDGDLCWACPVGGVAFAELTIGVVAPAPE